MSSAPEYRDTKMDKEFKNEVIELGLGVILEVVPDDLLHCDYETIKSTLKSLYSEDDRGNDALITREDYKNLLKLAREVKNKYSRKRKQSYKRYIDLEEFASKIQKLHDKPITKTVNNYLRESVAVYFNLREDFLEKKRNDDGDNSKRAEVPTKSGEVHRIASFLVGYNFNSENKTNLRMKAKGDKSTEVAKRVSSIMSRLRKEKRQRLAEQMQPSGSDNDTENANDNENRDDDDSMSSNGSSEED